MRDTAEMTVWARRAGTYDVRFGVAPAPPGTHHVLEIEGPGDATRSIPWVDRRTTASSPVALPAGRSDFRLTNAGVPAVPLRPGDPRVVSIRMSEWTIHPGGRRAVSSRLDYPRPVTTAPPALAAPIRSALTRYGPLLPQPRASRGPPALPRVRPGPGLDADHARRDGRRVLGGLQVPAADRHPELRAVPLRGPHDLDVLPRRRAARIQQSRGERGPRHEGAVPARDRPAGVHDRERLHRRGDARHRAARSA